MKSNFMFFLKASDKEFQFDVAKYEIAEISHRSPRMVFFSNDTNVAIKVADHKVEIRFGYESFGHCVINYNEITNELSVRLDELGLMAAFVHQNGATVCLSNLIEVLELALINRALSAEAIHFFCISGFLKPGTTFWRDIRKISGSYNWNSEAGRAEHFDSRWDSYATFDRAACVDDVIEALKNETHLLKHEVKPRELRLSGGADTRIVSYLWDEPIDAVSIQSPWMGDCDDLDINLAALWARELNLPHTVLRPTESEFAFLAGSSERPFLTGLCGGEFLGGQFHRVIPSNPDLWKKFVEESPTERDDWHRAVTEDSRIWNSECAKVFLQSARSTIYESVRGSWSAPYKLSISSVSPFCGMGFLKMFLSLSLESIGDYDFYAEVFEALGPRLQKFPLSSQLAVHRPKFRPTSEHGIDPKSVKRSSRSQTSESSVFADLEAIFKAQGIEFRGILVRKLLENPRTNINLRSLLAWLQPRFQTRLGVQG